MVAQIRTDAIRAQLPKQTGMEDSSPMAGAYDHRNDNYGAIRTTLTSMNTSQDPSQLHRTRVRLVSAACALASLRFRLR